MALALLLLPVVAIDVAAAEAVVAFDSNKARCLSLADEATVGLAIKEARGVESREPIEDTKKGDKDAIRTNWQYRKCLAEKTHR